MSITSDKALRKIGRNLVNLSKLEGMLKLFMSRINFQSPISQLAVTLEQQKKKYQSMTLGQISKEYFKTFNFNPDEIHQKSKDVKGTWISFSFDTKTDEVREIKAAFDHLVFERNRLVHGMLIEFSPDSQESCNELITELDKQNEIIQVEYKQIQDKLYLLHEGIKQFIQKQYKEITGKDCEPIDEILRQ